MSIVAGDIFPNTTFPDSVQTLPTFSDLDESQQIIYSRYIKSLLEGDFLGANTYLKQLNPDSMITAQSLNTLSDTIGAIQALYSSSDVFTDIIAEKQSEWEEKIDTLKYVGAWIQPSLFSTSINYSQNKVVLYNDLMWIRTNVASPSTGGYPIPQNNSIYWTPYYRKNSMVSILDSTSNKRYLYIAITDISILESPKANSTSSTPQWLELTKEGVKGDNGESFNFSGSWDRDTTYSLGNLVIYNKNCYSSLQNDNISHNPGVSTTWWRKEFSINVPQIPVQAEQPTTQEVGDIWFKEIELR